MNFTYVCLLILLSFFLSLVLCRVCIPLLRRLSGGQMILSYVKEHQGKNGTPTMGGIAFIIAAVSATCLFVGIKNRQFVVAVVIGLSYLIVGLLDDLVKKKRAENLGLTAKQKIFFQIIVALFAALYCCRNGLTTLNLPFLNVKIDVGWWMIPLSVFVYLACVNCVNLTDGLDGLAASVCIPFFLFFGVLIHLQKDGNELAALSYALSAAIAAYLLFNTFPASVFMGDTGSLALGGFAASIGILTGNALYIAVVGACFVLSGGSVILQVLYFKCTKGKRIFKMTPIHHHFQQCGYSESKIAYAYFTVTAILSVVCLVFVV